MSTRYLNKKPTNWVGSIFFVGLMAMGNIALAGTLYMVDSSGKLYTMDHDSGTTLEIGSTGGATDIASDCKNLYAVNWGVFKSIDPLTGVGTVIGSIGYSTNALAISPINGKIYAAGGSNFIEIDSETGNGTHIGNYGSGFSSSGDLAFDNTGTLYATVSGGDKLVTVDVDTGVATLIGSIGFGGVYGISFKDGVLYGVTSSGEFLTINTTTAAGTLIGTNAKNQYGLTTWQENCTCIEPPSEMVAWWPLDETSGTTANETINDNDGTHQNGPDPVSGKVAGALFFDGVDDYVEVPDNDVLDFGQGQDFSIDAWIRTKKANGIQTIVDKRYEDGSADTKGYSFYLYNGKLGLQLATGDGTWACGSAGKSCTNYISSGTNLADGKWHHVAVTIDRDNEGIFYVDGLSDDTFNPTFRIGDLSNDQPLTIGRNTNTIASSHFQGNIDEVEIFKRVLKADEVHALWFADKHGKCKKSEPLSVNLDKFTANAADGKITINWTTGTETNNAGFILWRATPINGQCTTNPYNYKDVRQVKPLVYSKAKDGVLGVSYSEEDNNVEPGIRYCYGLEDIDYEGKRTFHIDKIISARLN
jgi:hypothetical protein